MAQEEEVISPIAVIEDEDYAEDMFDESNSCAKRPQSNEGGYGPSIQGGGSGGGVGPGSLYYYKRDLQYFLGFCGVAHCWNHRLERLCGSDEEDQAKVNRRHDTLYAAYKAMKRNAGNTACTINKKQPKRAKRSEEETPILRHQRGGLQENQAHNNNAHSATRPTPIPQEPVSPNDERPLGKLPTYSCCEEELQLREAWDVIKDSTNNLLHLDKDKEECSRRLSRLERFFFNALTGINYQDAKKKGASLTQNE